MKNIIQHIGTAYTVGNTQRAKVLIGMLPAVVVWMRLLLGPTARRYGSVKLRLVNCGVYATSGKDSAGTTWIVVIKAHG